MIGGCRTSGGFTSGGGWWNGVVWTVDVWITEMDGPTRDYWADLGWETPKLWRKCKSGGVVSLLPRGSLVSGDDSEDSEFNWSKSPRDLVLKGFTKSNWDCCKAERFSGTELALKGDLKIVEDCILGDFLRILSRLSTISGGSGSRWALVWIFLGATMLSFKTQVKKKSSTRYDNLWRVN